MLNDLFIILIAYSGLFLSIIFAAISIRIACMSDSEYKREQNKYNKKGLYVDTNKNEWVSK